MESSELMAVWSEVTDIVEHDLGVSEALAGFLRLTRPVALLEGTLLLMAPNDLTKRMIEDRARESILDILRPRIDQPEVRMRVIVDAGALEELSRHDRTEATPEAGSATQQPNHSSSQPPSHAVAPPRGSDRAEAAASTQRNISETDPESDTFLSSIRSGTPGSQLRGDQGGTSPGITPQADIAGPAGQGEPPAETSSGRGETDPTVAYHRPHLHRPGTPDLRSAEEAEPDDDRPEGTQPWRELSSVPAQDRPTERHNDPAGVPRSTGARTAPAVEPARLNPRYVFDSFVIGSSNRFAHAASVAVAEAPAQAYNPLFVYGDSGLGKTHLLHAIGHYAQRLYANMRVRFVNSEEFTNEFINSIRDDRASVFQQRYRDVDLLLIDDIQFLNGKVQTQEEFFHTFNALHQANKQVVITSDVAPRQLTGFEERMRSRFEWGLLTDIQPPDLETRIAILRRKAESDRLDGPDDVLEYIASNITTNIRELEGALIRVTAYASLNKLPVTLDLAQLVLKDLIGEQGREITAPLIITKTAEYFELSEDDIRGPSRSRTIVTARQIAMFLCREMTELSLPKIGQAFGGRDHTTVMHAERKVRQLMTEKPATWRHVSELGVRIRNQ
ncbi:MAG: chromosomal replication initiator protein DnaA [Actinomycetales bacterium]